MLIKFPRCSCNCVNITEVKNIVCSSVHSISPTQCTALFMHMQMLFSDSTTQTSAQFYAHAFDSDVACLFYGRRHVSFRIFTIAVRTEDLTWFVVLRRPVSVLYGIIARMPTHNMQPFIIQRPRMTNFRNLWLYNRIINVWNNLPATDVNFKSHMLLKRFY